MKLFIYSLLSVLIVAGMYACKDDKDIIPDTHGRVMVFNTIPQSSDFPSINVKVDTVAIATNLQVGDTSVFSVFKAQKYTASIFSSASLLALAQGELVIRNNHSFSFFVGYDNLAGTGVNPVTAIVTDDDLTPPVQQNSKLRIIDMSSSFSDTTGAKAISYITVMLDRDSAIIYNGLRFTQVTGFLTIQPGVHKLYFRSYADAVPVKRDSITLQMDSTRIYTVYTTGNINNQSEFKAYSYRHYK